MMTHDLHIHMILDGVYYRAAIDAHKTKPVDALIRRRLEAYQTAGITYLRDGGDAWGVCTRARELAGDYGITYVIPTAPIHKKGHYGAFIGTGWDELSDFRALLAKAHNADFIKLMLSGIMDFREYGRLTEAPLDSDTIREIIHIAHGEGFAVMAHCNGAEAVKAALSAKVDSIEHGAYMDDEAIHMLASSQTVWVPTLSAVGNLIGCGRFPDDTLRAILNDTSQKVRRAAQLGAIIGCGSDAGAYRVYHAQGAADEYRWLQKALGDGTDGILNAALGQIRRQFVRY